MSSDPKKSGDSNTNIDIRILEELEKEIEHILMKQSMKRDFEKLIRDYPLIASEFMMFPEHELTDEMIDVILNQSEEVVLKLAKKKGQSEMEDLEELL